MEAFLGLIFCLGFVGSVVWLVVQWVRRMRGRSRVASVQGQNQLDTPKQVEVSRPKAKKGIEVDFWAFDVETASKQMGSICQVGVVGVKGGKIVHQWQSLVNPEDSFDPSLTAIHGISERDVKSAPKFPEIYPTLALWFDGQIVASHTGFDKARLNRSCERYGLAQIGCRWLDTAAVARQAWPQFSEGGFGLANLAQRLGFKFEHHRADEDARVAALVLLKAMEEGGVRAEDWLERVSGKPRSGGRWGEGSVTREGNPKGKLFGEVVVFTGQLSLSREAAANAAAEAGCKVEANVTKRTTLLVVGTQNGWMLAGKDKSSKHLKAEEMVAKGAKVRIVGEAEFFKLIKKR